MTSERSLILASESPQRLKLLKGLRIPFRVIPARINERSRVMPPRRRVLSLALRKARRIAQRHPDALVLGADTIVVCRGKILGKPKNAADALRILGLLNGQWHRVYTGIALVHRRSRKSWLEAACSRVKARRVPAEMLAKLAGKHLDKAGAYAVQDHQDPFIEKVVGSMDNVIGLPLANVRSLIRKAARDRSFR